jgi:hypothetical protein
MIVNCLPSAHQGLNKTTKITHASHSKQGTPPSPQFGKTISLRTLTLGSLFSLVVGIGTSISGWVQYGGYNTHPTEVKITTNLKAANQVPRTGALFDTAKHGIKNGISRFWKGERASNKTKALQDFQTSRNAEKRLQDCADPILKMVSENTDAQAIIDSNIGRIRAERDAYYDLTQKTIELAHDNPKTTVGKLLTDYRTSRLAEDVKKLDEHDQKTVMLLYKVLLAEPKRSALERTEEFYQDYVNEIVKKHNPDKVEDCLNAGKQVFQSIKDQKATNRNHLNRDLLALAFALPGALGLFIALNAAMPPRSFTQQYKRDCSC